MIRRLAAFWCLCAVLFGQAAQASVLVLYPYELGTEGSAQAAADGRNQVQRNLRLVENILRATGSSFATIRSDLDSTESFRIGQVVANRGTAGRYIQQYDATVAIGLQIVASKVGQVRADSLCNMRRQGNATTTALAVPMLRIIDNARLVTTGSYVGGGGLDSAGAVNANFDAGAGKAVFFANDHRAFLTNAYVVGATQVYDTGDLRKILFGAIPQADYRISNGTNSGAVVGCRNCDSLMSYAANDTLLLWDRQFSTRLGQASTMSFVSAYGAGCALDSINGAGCPPTEGDLTLILAGLAHLDSLSGHKVFGNKIIRIAPVVYGGLARGPRHSWNWNKTQGISPSDTAVFYGFLDSLAAYPDIKVTFAVNVDSASTYTRDIIKLKSVPQARFTPQIWGGVDDTTLTAYADFPKDVFGRYNKRIALGDSLNHSLIVSGDSSIAWQAKRALNMCDSLFPGRVSRVAAAPVDDWSPLQITGADNGGTGIDSVLYALQRAGYVGVIADAQDPDANASNLKGGPAKTNPRGYYNRQQSYSSGSIAALRNFKILTHSGFCLLGGRSQCETYKNNGGVDADSSSSFTITYATIYAELGRLWESALLDYDESYDLWPYDNPSNVNRRNRDDIWHRKLDYTQAKARHPVQHGNIVRLSCADLSGASGTSVVPAAPMWHVLKAAANAMYVINKLAGRTVVMFDYPENIQP